MFENLPLPISPFYFISICWFVALAKYHPDVLISKSLIYIYVFALLYVLLDIAGVYHIDYRRFFIRFIVPLFLSISIYTYYLSVRDYEGLSRLVLFSLIFITITALTTIIGVQDNPMAARQIGGALQGHGESELVDKYQKMGIATFGFFSGLAFASPVIIASLKQKWKKRWKKRLFIAGIILVCYAYFKAQYTTALLFALAGAIMALVGTKNKERAFIVACFLFALIFIIPKTSLINPIYNISGYLGSTFLQKRVHDLGEFIEEGENYRADRTHASIKLARIPILIKSIKENLLLGGGVNTGHNFWLDWFSEYGIIGLIPWVLIITQQMRFNLKIFSEDYKYYYLLSMFSFISFGFINNLGGSHMYLVVFIIIPGMFYLSSALRYGIPKKYNYNMDYSSLLYK